MPAYRWPIERGGKYEIKIKKGKWRNQIILLVNFPEMERSDPLSFHQQDSAPYHCKQ
jgi:hypothetical protein